VIGLYCDDPASPFLGASFRCTGANVETTKREDGIGNTPLILASERGYADEVKLLLKYKANVRAVEKNGADALAMACHFGHTDVMYLLLDSGADVNSPDRVGMSALHYAAKRGFVDIVSALVSCGANMDLESRRGHTPLSLAIKSGEIGVVSKLVELGTHSEAAQIALKKRESDVDGPKAFRGMLREGNFGF